jgi:DNA-binding transcriptional MocR family regulator
MAGRLEARVDRESGIPLGRQLAGGIRAAVAGGELAAGDRLPSVRELAELAGVNVNTVRAVYARLEVEGLVRSEHGRGTFVAGGLEAGAHGREAGVAGVREPGGQAAGALRASAPTRRELREQIAALEATLARLPPPPLAEGAKRRPPGGALLSTEELVDVRDRLLDRLDQLDTERSALLESLEQLGFDAPAAGEREAPSRRATPSLAGARIRWVGA